MSFKCWFYLLCLVTLLVGLIVVIHIVLDVTKAIWMVISFGPRLIFKIKEYVSDMADTTPRRLRAKSDPYGAQNYAGSHPSIWRNCSKCSAVYFKRQKSSCCMC